MNPQNKWLKVAGIVLNVLIAALMIFAGSGSVPLLAVKPGSPVLQNVSN